MGRSIFYGLLFSLLIFCGTPAFPQPGLAEMQQASQDLNNSFFSAQDAAFMLAAILGIIGGIRVYHNWQMGRPHITTEIAAWFFACLFMSIMGAFLRVLYGM